MSRRGISTRRRGGVYALVLITVMVVVCMCVTGMEIQTVARKQGGLWQDALEARLIARSAAEMAIERTYSVPAWRALSAGWTGAYSLGRGTGTAQMSDPIDGNLNNNSSDPVVVVGRGVVGEATQQVQVTLDAFFPAMTSLQRAMHVGGTLTFTNASVWATDVIGTNMLATAANSSINAPVYAVTPVAGGTYSAGSKSGQALCEMPDATVGDYYLAKGTRIASSSLAVLNVLTGSKKMNNFVLSPGSNPWGSVNADGIYIIDMLGKDLEISDCRIRGTLLILNPGLNTTVLGSVLWEPATPGFPLLVVMGGLTLNTSSTPLSEASLAYNFNPASTPYQGQSDSANDDVYPSVLAGLVYCSGSMTISGQVNVRGAVIAGVAATVNGALSIAYDPVYFTAAPPGFRSAPQMVVRPGSWRRLVD